MVEKRRRQRLVDYAIYVGVGIAVVASVLALAIYQDELGLERSDRSRWPGSIVVTLLVVPTLIRGNWILRKARGFWPVVGLLLMAHLFVVALVWWVDDLWFKGGLGKVLWVGLLFGELAIGESVLWSLRKRRS